MTLSANSYSTNPKSLGALVSGSIGRLNVHGPHVFSNRSMKSLLTFGEIWLTTRVVDFATFTCIALGGLPGFGLVRGGGLFEVGRTMGGRLAVGGVDRG